MLCTSTIYRSCCQRTVRKPVDYLALPSHLTGDFMVYYAQIKLGTDILLVLSLVLLCYRLLVSGSLSGKTTQLMLLEASLKGLIKDAEGAGRSLNDELQRRQHSLERVLTDFEGHEKRLTAMQEGTTKQLQEVDAKAKNAQAVFARLSQMSTPAPLRASEEAPEPPSFQSLTSRSEKERHKLPERRTQRNRLAEKIERAIAPTTEAVEQTTREVQQITEVAEESAAKEQSEDLDPRLGVLGAMKRQTQTL